MMIWCKKIMGGKDYEVEAVATATGLTKADSTRAIDATFAAITDRLECR